MRKSKYTQEVLEAAVKDAETMAQVLRNLGIGVNGGNHRSILARLKQLGIDTSHFKGQGWLKGKTAKEVGSLNQVKAEDVIAVKQLRRRGILYRVMIEHGIEYQCGVCSLSPEWQGRPLTLHIDHINGDNTDNSLANLRFLCPNCHQQTDTWGSKIVRGLCRKCRRRLSIKNQTGYCVKCLPGRGTHTPRKVANRPKKEDLIRMIEETSYSAVGRLYGVSDNAIRKWLKAKN